MLKLLMALMALSSDTEILTMYPNVGYIVDVPSNIADTYYKGALVNFNAAGSPVVAADTASTFFAGICQQQVVVASGEDKDIKILRNTVARIAHTGAARADVGNLFYATADDTLADTATNVTPCGQCVGFETGYLWIDTAIRFAS